MENRRETPPSAFRSFCLFFIAYLRSVQKLCNVILPHYLSYFRQPLTLKQSITA